MGNIKSIRKFNILGGRQAGQGMTEYIIIVALIAVAAIGVYSYFGQTLRNQTAGIATELSGQSAKDNIKNSQDSASNAGSQANVNKALGNYNADDNLHKKQ
ncbi:MAG TPA: pilus assembly protein [Burkholderiales bacterium]|nr:pilus assembly protein [Burkholderiales bacterium]